MKVGAGNYPTRRVAFLVPTQNLVKQQVTLFEKFLPPDIPIVGLVGGETDDRKGPLRVLLKDPAHYKIFIITAGLLKNAMKYPARSENLVSLKEFSLLIIDECHHTFGGLLSYMYFYKSRQDFGSREAQR